MKIETDMPTYERLKRCLSERFPDVKVQLITSDPMLKKLGFAEKVPCTNEILAGLGQLYVADERFRKNIDKHGEGTAAYASACIQQNFQ